MLHFLGIGAQKSGTSWLYENLLRHPEIYFPDGKEVHFWDKFHDRGMDWYESLFPDDNGKVNGEITPAYAILEQDKIRSIYNMNTDMRLIYIVRNPIERAWSAALMDMGYQNLDFDETPDEWFIEHFYSEGSLQRGDYKTCISNWGEIFPHEQLLVMIFADIKSNPQGFMQTCARHIGVDPEFYGEHTGNLIAEKVRAGKGFAIRPNLQDALVRLYGKNIEEFNSFMGRPLFSV